MKTKTSVYTIILAQLISTIGDQLTLVASFSAISLKTGNYILAASPLLVKGVVHLLFGFISLNFVDRFSAKTISVLSDFVRFVLILSIVFINDLSTEYLLLIQGICSILDIFFTASREKILNSHIDHLPAKEVSKALALDNQIATVVEVLGFGIGFIIIASLPYQDAFIIDAATFLLSGILLSCVKDISVKSEKTPGFYQLVESFKYLKKSEDLFHSTVARSFFWVGAGIFNMIGLSVVGRLVESESAVSSLALLRMFESIGFIGGLFLIQRFVAELTDTKQEIGYLFNSCAIGLAGASITILGLIPVQPVIFTGIMFSLHGLSCGYNSYGVRRIRQIVGKDVPQQRARVAALSNMFAKLSEVFGMLLVTVGGAAAWGIAPPIIVASVSLALGSLVCFRVKKSREYKESSVVV